MTQPENTPTQSAEQILTTEVALAAGKQAITAAVEQVVSVISETKDPNVRADLASEFHGQLVESGVVDIMPVSEEKTNDSSAEPLVRKTYRTRDQVIIESKAIFWARRRGLRPRIKKTS